MDINQEQRWATRTDTERVEARAALYKEKNVGGATIGELLNNKVNLPGLSTLRSWSPICTRSYLLKYLEPHSYLNHTKYFTMRTSEIAFFYP
jgi:hypothetical protein